MLTSLISWLQDLLRHEPVLILGLVQAGIALAVGFGLAWTAEQVSLVVAFSAAVLSVIARQRVSPL